MTYNAKSPAVKRLMKEAKELSEPTEFYYAQPIDDNLFEWHFTIRGPEDSDFAGGVYHGKISLPSDYPMKPPNITMFTPNGRFEPYRQICLSISDYHPESWRPSWSIRTALLALIGFMPNSGAGAIGSLDFPPEERQRLSKSSLAFVCDACGVTSELLRPLTAASSEITREAIKLASQITMTSLVEQPEVALTASVKLHTEGVGVTVSVSSQLSGTTHCDAPIGLPSRSQACLPSRVVNATAGLTSHGVLQPSHWLCYPVYSPNPSTNQGPALEQPMPEAAKTSPPVPPSVDSQHQQQNGLPVMSRPMDEPLSFDQWLKEQIRVRPASELKAAEDASLQQPAESPALDQETPPAVAPAAEPAVAPAAEPADDSCFAELPSSSALHQRRPTGSEVPIPPTRLAAQRLLQSAASRHQQRVANITTPFPAPSHTARHLRIVAAGLAMLLCLLVCRRLLILLR